jgi:hypothetical protein
VSEEGAPVRREGWGPFAIFGIALVVAAVFALYEGFAYSPTLNFSAAALPTLIGVIAAVVAVLLIGSRAPPNE